MRNVSVRMATSSMSLNILYFMTDTSRGDTRCPSRKEARASARKRRSATTGIRGSREDRPRPEGLGDDRLRLEARKRRRVFDQAQHDADRQSLERRLETAAALRRRRRRTTAPADRSSKRKAAARAAFLFCRRVGEDHVGMADALPRRGEQAPASACGDFRKSSKASSARKPNIVLLPLRAIFASSSMTWCMRLRLVVANSTRRLSTPR